MALSGIPADYPIPGHRREILFNQGSGGDTIGQRYILLGGNKTSAGSETADTLGDPIADDADAKNRFGARSELYQMFRVARSVNPLARIYAIAIAENGSAAAATRAITFANAATASCNGYVDWGGETVSFSVASGDSVTTIAAAAKAAINSASQGSWPLTSDNSSGVLTLTAANGGPRGDNVVGRVRIRFDKSTTDVATTISYGAVSSGTGADDTTNAVGVVANGTYYYQAWACTATSGLTATDSGAGEVVANVISQALPANGKDQQAFFGLVGTASQATTVASSTGGNSALAKFFWSENSPYTSGMIAALHASLAQVLEGTHPSANWNGYAHGDGTPYPMPAPYLTTDYPTASELESCLRNGVTPIEITALGTPRVCRVVTSKCLVSGTTTTDYRAREGHIPSAVHFAWATLQGRYVAQAQPFAGADPGEGQPPVAATDTPSSIKAIVEKVTRDLCGSTPLDSYEGPILAPDKLDAMLASISVSGPTQGKFNVEWNPVAVTHNLGTNTKIRESGASY